MAVPVAAQQTDYNQHAAISIASSGDNTVIVAVSGKRISIYGLDLYCGTATAVTLKDGSTALTGAMTVSAYSLPLKSAPAYWILTSGNAFVINLGAANQCSGAVWYSQN